MAGAKRNELPDYVTRIEDTRQKTFERFQEDFLSRLQNNINDIKRQIDELNNALKDVPLWWALSIPNHSQTGI